MINIPPLPDDDDVVLGDVDGDGDVDFEDIPLFIQLLTGGSVNAQAGLPGLAMGADGLRARRMAVTA